MMGSELKKGLVRLLFVFYIGLLVKVILLRGVSPGEFWELTVHSPVWRFIPRPLERINWVPFDTIRLYIDYYRIVTLELSLLNLVGNVLLFIPLGFLLKLQKNPPLKGGMVLVLGMALSLLLEGLQYVSGTGVMDIDDVMLNSLGVGIGLGLYLVMKGLKGLF
jgi:glycopeptide antibiotics resistance protein